MTEVQPRARLAVSLCVLCLFKGLRRLCWEVTYGSCSFISSPFLILSAPFLGLPFSSYSRAWEGKYETGQMLTPAFQSWLSHLGCKYEWFKSSTQILTLGYLPYSLVAVLLLFVILVRQLQHEYSTVSIWVNRDSLLLSVTSSVVLTR